jgi:hypothetical protein
VRRELLNAQPWAASGKRAQDRQLGESEAAKSLLEYARSSLVVTAEQKTLNA